MKAPPLVTTLVLLLAACGKKDAPPRPETKAVAAEAATHAGEAAALARKKATNDDVEPVYRVDPKAKEHPLAKKLCEGLTAMPEARRAACCRTSSGIVLTSECTRTLSAALASEAVTLAEADVDACLAAYDATLSGCDWVGPFMPGPPAACQGIVKGRLADGATCRSSLECTGSLRCHGAGPTTPGRCGPPKADGELCGGSVDTLATFVRQDDVDARHPECSERCTKHRCARAVAEGAACTTSLECADGLACVTGTTAARGKSAPARKCAPAPAAKPIARKEAGASCTSDFECVGGCVRTDPSKPGVCGARCDLR